MKLISRVAPIEVKRAFVAANDTRGYRRGQQVKLSREDFERNFAKAKKRAKKLNDAQLDRIIGGQYIKRLDAYNSVDWYVGTVKTDEVAVWRGAGGIPVPWTRGSLSETGKMVAMAIKKKSKRLKRRARLALPGILSNSLDKVQKEKYLLPIILPAGTIKGCRGSFKRFKGDVDDGCMRSIALAVSGKKMVRAYIGAKRKV